eukprot:g1799.t1
MSKQFHDKGAFRSGLGSKAGGFVAQKFFHPSNHVNQEKMWLYQQKELEKKKKQEEREMRLAEERKLEEIRKANALLGQGAPSSSKAGGGFKQLGGDQNKGGLQVRGGGGGRLEDMYSDLTMRKNVDNLRPEERASVMETQKRLKKMREDQKRLLGGGGGANGGAGGTTGTSPARPPAGKEVDGTSGGNKDKNEQEFSRELLGGGFSGSDALSSKGVLFLPREGDDGGEEKLGGGTSSPRQRGLEGEAGSNKRQRSRSPSPDADEKVKAASAVHNNIPAAAVAVPSASSSSAPKTIAETGVPPPGAKAEKKEKIASSMIHSTMYKENVFKYGHTTAYGSYFDATTGLWGYACCKTVGKRNQPCPLSTFGRNASFDGEDGVTSMKKAAKKRKH